MSAYFNKLSVKDVRKETADTVSIAFEVPEALKDAYRFTQGQYLTLRMDIEGEEVRRSYSICSAKGADELRIAIKKVEGGLFSNYASKAIRDGDLIEVMTPQGKFFTPLSAENEHVYVAFAAGSGITPIISILKTTLFEESKSKFILFYGNRGFDHIVFREELEALKNLYPDRLSVHHVLSRESLGSDLFYGRMDAEKCRKYRQYFFQPQAIDAFFLCGPEEMIFEIKDTLIALGAAPEKIHFELFTTSSAHKKKRPAQQLGDVEAVFDAAITVIQDGTKFDFNLTSDGSSLLDAAMRAGADLPFACKGGVCSTCKAKLLEGQVEMEVNYGLEADEVANGFVLTCQAHPKTPKVVVSFDF
jgi:ring-1,2-phenylacetyl-CoA epoxidase subunit PaaE